MECTVLAARIFEPNPISNWNWLEVAILGATNEGYKECTAS